MNKTNLRKAIAVVKKHYSNETIIDIHTHSLSSRWSGECSALNGVDTILLSKMLFSDKKAKR